MGEIPFPEAAKKETEKIETPEKLLKELIAELHDTKYLPAEDEKALQQVANFGFKSSSPEVQGNIRDQVDGLLTNIQNDPNHKEFEGDFRSRALQAGILENPVEQPPRAAAG